MDDLLTSHIDTERLDKNHSWCLGSCEDWQILSEIMGPVRAKWEAKDANLD